jgi:hypothetical protein
LNDRCNPVLINSIELYTTRHQQSTVCVSDFVCLNRTLRRRIKRIKIYTTNISHDIFSVLLIILWLSISWFNLLMSTSPAILYLWETKLFPPVTPLRISSITQISVIVVGSPCFLQNFNFWTSTYTSSKLFIPLFWLHLQQHRTQFSKVWDLLLSIRSKVGWKDWSQILQRLCWSFIKLWIRI